MIPEIEVAQGNLAIALLDGGMTYVGFIPLERREDVLEAFERRMGASQSDRYDRHRQASLRIEIARRLRLETGADDFADLLAAGCLWLAVRHWKNGAELAVGIDRAAQDDGFAVLSCAIGETPGTMKDTAWSFMVGSKIYDGRDQLALQAAETVRLI